MALRFTQGNPEALSLARKRIDATSLEKPLENQTDEHVATEQDAQTMPRLAEESTG